MKTGVSSRAGLAGQHHLHVNSNYSKDKQLSMAVRLHMCQSPSLQPSLAGSLPKGSQQLVNDGLQRRGSKALGCRGTPGSAAIAAIPPGYCRCSIASTLQVLCLLLKHRPAKKQTGSSIKATCEPVISSHLVSQGQNQPLSRALPASGSMQLKHCHPLPASCPPLHKAQPAALGWEMPGPATHRGSTIPYTEVKGCGRVHKILWAPQCMNRKLPSRLTN